MYAGALIFSIITAMSVAGTAHAVRASHHFYINSPAFSVTDRNGTFNAQVNYDAPGHPPLAWSYNIAPQVEAIATSPMTCTAGLVEAYPN